MASTDAPCSALSVIYTETGEFEEYRFFPRNPDLVLVDSQIVANAPVSLLIAGVGDALATWLEARATPGRTPRRWPAGCRPLTGTALAELSWDVLWENALPAIDAVKDHLVTPAVEKVIEANTLLSGLGFESGGLAAAHAIHNGLTAVGATHGLAHGQKVNIGSVTQLVLEGAPTSRHPRLHRVHHPGRPAEHAHRGRPQAPTTTSPCRPIADAATVRRRDDPLDAVRGAQRRRGQRAGLDRTVRARVRREAQLPDPVRVRGAPLTFTGRSPARSRHPRAAAGSRSAASRNAANAPGPSVVPGPPFIRITTPSISATSASVVPLRAAASAWA